MRLPCVALLLLPLLAAAFLQHAPARNDNARQLSQPPHMLLAAARNSRVVASPKLAVKQLGAAATKSKRAAAAPKAARASKAKPTAGTSKRKAAVKVGVVSTAKAASSAASSVVKSTAKKTPGVRATTAKSTVGTLRGPAVNDSFQQLEALFNQADAKNKPERALASSTAHLLLQLLTTGLKADHTKLLRDMLLELLYTVNKTLKKVEQMPDHGLFVRAEHSKVPGIARK